MEKLELRFTYEKETKNCIRYQEELGEEAYSSGDIAIGYLYVQKEALGQQMGISQGRVAQVLINLLGANIFISDKAKVRDAVRLYLQGISHREIAKQFNVSQPIPKKLKVVIESLE